jgi:hypothetical protein
MEVLIDYLHRSSQDFLAEGRNLDVHSGRDQDHRGALPESMEPEIVSLDAEHPLHRNQDIYQLENPIGFLKGTNFNVE